MLSTNAKGAIAEAEIAAAGMRLGIAVLRPVTEHGRYDLIFDVGARLLRVQCKWAPKQGDVVVIRCQSNRRAREGIRWRGYSSADVDAIAAYCAETDTCYLLPIKGVAERRQIQLRLKATANGQRGAVVWARDFEFSSIDWTVAGAVAQLEERRRGTPKATGSSPVSSMEVPAEAVVVQTGAHQFRNHFGYYLDRAADGEEIHVTRRGKPYARLMPPEPHQAVTV